MAVTTRKLKSPLVVGDKEIKEVTIAEPTFDDIADIGAPSDASSTSEKMAMMKKYIARCTGLPEDAVGKLKASDALALLSEVAGFFTVSE